jgi:CRISPR/Cas system CSM-associated protein Csm2 small subunit
VGVIETIPCPFCDREVAAGRWMQTHMGACIENPTVLEAVKAALVDNAVTEGVAPSISTYQELATWEEGLPSLQTLLAQVSWSELCARCGLATAKYARSTGGQDRPAAIMAEARRLAQILAYEHNYGPNQTDWEIFSDITPSVVHKQFGRWEDMLLAAGLVKAPAAYYKERAAVRREQLAAMVEHEIDRIERKILAEDRLAQQIEAIDRGIRHIWDWTRHTYVQAHVYELR